MVEYTEKLNLELPEQNEFYNVNIHNQKHGKKLILPSRKNR